MPVVSNTSPILNLAIIGKLELLRTQCREVLIPPAVLHELRVNEDLPGSIVIREALNAGWIQVLEPDNISLTKTLQRYLDVGESEAISLSLQVGASLLLLDEKDARAAAKNLGLRVAGVLGILCRAKYQGENISLKESMDELRIMCGFRIHDKLYTEIALK
jgi:predicted nucleic acid-binding protein